MSLGTVYENSFPKTMVSNNQSKYETMLPEPGQFWDGEKG